MRIQQAAVALLPIMLSGTCALSQEHERPVPRIDHAFVILMENHHYSQVIGNVNAPFINSYAKTANLATNYYAVGHPSLTNYLEIVGGSNFGVINDDAPDWHNSSCVPNLAGGIPADESAATNTCPIAGSGWDAATPAVDTTNEGTPEEPVNNFPLSPAFTRGITIADQLVEAGKSWKSYQEDLPPYGADGVNASDGLVSNMTQSEPGMPQLYAVKHNPFAYFANVQGGEDHKLSLTQMVGFDALYADLAKGDVPDLAFIAPNQCHDQHTRGSSEMGTGCSVDQNAIAQGDAGLHTLINAIKGSKAWKHGTNVIVVVWDENDYSSLPNQVVTIVDTNYAPTGIQSDVRYNHFSLLKTLEAGFGLPYLNHAADQNVKLMSDLFSGHK
jgi:phosphatidylinositol-3-phosphatase